MNFVASEIVSAVCFKSCFGKYLKGGPSDLGTKILQKEKSSLYSQSLLIFIHRTSAVERHPITREIKRFTMAHVDTKGKNGLFLH